MADKTYEEHLSVVRELASHIMGLRERFSIQAVLQDRDRLYEALSDLVLSCNLLSADDGEDYGPPPSTDKAEAALKQSAK